MVHFSTGLDNSAYAPSFVALGVAFKPVSSLTLTTGSYVLIAKTTLDMPSMEGTGCELIDSTAGMIDRNNVSSVMDDTLTLISPLTTTGSTVTVQCASNEADAQTEYTHLVAIKLRIGNRELKASRSRASESPRSHVAKKVF